MKLYYVTNGFQYDLPISALAVTESPERAIELAKPLFDELLKKKPRSTIMTKRELKRWNTLEATELCPDTAVEWCSELGEGLYEK